jgi:hypothetical protein
MSKPTRRCEWEDGRGRCRQQGTGTPALCPRHFRLYHFPEGDAEPTLFESVLNHPSVRRFGRTVDERLQGLMNQLADGMEDRVAQMLGGAPHQRPGYQGPESGFHSEWPPRVEADEPPNGHSRGHNGHTSGQSSHQEDPRVVLGFSPTESLSASIIKKRRRELARLFHTDVGGNPESMRRLNQAADALLAQVA